jgi:hypothetical protein
LEAALAEGETGGEMGTVGYSLHVFDGYKTPQYAVIPLISGSSPIVHPTSKCSSSGLSWPLCRAYRLQPMRDGVDLRWTALMLW